MPRLLFAIEDREFNVNHGRLLHLVRMLASDGYKVDILTPSDEVHVKAAETLKGSENVNVLLVKSAIITLSDSFRDDLTKTFVRQTQHIVFPETDMKMYKVSAFDDFRGFLMGYTYPDINILSYDAVLMPILSIEKIPTFECDCFYSAISFLAKEKKIPLVGLHIHPPVGSAFMCTKMMDCIVVKKEWEKQYLERLGIEDERIFLLTDEREAYCLKSVEDTYMDDLIEFMNSGEIEIDKKEFCITVINHPRFRPQVRQVLSAIAELGLPGTLFLIKAGYNVKDLEEQDVIDLVYGDVIKNMKCKAFYAGHVVGRKLLLLSDIAVSATYLEMLGLAARYKTTVVVYNGMLRDLATGDGVIFMDDPDELKEVILKCYREKAETAYLSDCVGRLCGKAKS